MQRKCNNSKLAGKFLCDSEVFPAVLKIIGAVRTVPSFGNITKAFCTEVRIPPSHKAELSEPAAEATSTYVNADLREEERAKVKRILKLELVCYRLVRQGASAGLQKRGNYTLFVAVILTKKGLSALFVRPHHFA